MQAGVNLGDLVAASRSSTVTTERHKVTQHLQNADTLWNGLVDDCAVHGKRRLKVRLIEQFIQQSLVVTSLRGGNNEPETVTFVRQVLRLRQVPGNHWVRLRRLLVFLPVPGDLTHPVNPNLVDLFQYGLRRHHVG